MDQSGLIDAYLDELLAALSVEPARARRILAETEDHLHEGTARNIENGMGELEAERAAIAAFGSPRQVADGFNRAVSVPFRSWAPPLAAWLLLLVSVGMLAVGLAGEFSVGLGLAFGKEYVSGDINGMSYTPGRCADFFSFHPEAADCASAATLHHFDEIWRNADLALVAGVVAGAVAFVWRRRAHSPARAESLGRSAFAILGMAAFGLAAPVLIGYGGLTAAANGGVRSLPPAVDGLIALACFAAFARPGWRELRNLAAG